VFAAYFMSSSFLRAMCSSVPGRYAFALFRVAAQRDVMDSILEEVCVAASLLKRGSPVRIIVLRLFQGRLKPSWFDDFIKFTKFSDITINFLFLLATNKRIDCLPDIVRLLRMLIDNALNKESVVVYTACGVDQTTKNLIIENLLQVFKKQLNVSFEVDENIIGGLVARSSNIAIDVSVRNHIETLARSAKKYFDGELK
jgi:F-type H+-transporting ATPase subunit delta